MKKERSRNCQQRENPAPKKNERKKGETTKKKVSKKVRLPSHHPHHSKLMEEKTEEGNTLMNQYRFSVRQILGSGQGSERS